MTGDALVGPGRNNDPDPLRQLVQQIQDLRRYVDDKSAQILRTAGLRAMPDALTVEGALNVTGPMVVGGTLSLPAGIIDNDALASPATFDRVGSGASVTSITATTSALVSASLAVPAGYSQAIILAVGTLSGYAASGSGYIYTKATINTTSVTGNQTTTYASAGAPFAPATNHASTTLTGLSGGSITVRLMASAGATITTGGGSVAVLDAIVIYLR